MSVIVVFLCLGHLSVAPWPHSSLYISSKGSFWKVLHIELGLSADLQFFILLYDLDWHSFALFIVHTCIEVYAIILFILCVPVYIFCAYKESFVA